MYINSDLLKIAHLQWIYPLKMGGFSSSLCKRLPEGIIHTSITYPH